eukprot:4288829-Pleurochrysis_carterae.AAC.1
MSCRMSAGSNRSLHSHLGAGDGFGVLAGVLGRVRARPTERAFRQQAVGGRELVRGVHLVFGAGRARRRHGHGLEQLFTHDRA